MSKVSEQIPILGIRFGSEPEFVQVARLLTRPPLTLRSHQCVGTVLKRICYSRNDRCTWAKVATDQQRGLPNFCDIVKPLANSWVAVKELSLSCHYIDTYQTTLFWNYGNLIQVPEQPPTFVSIVRSNEA